MKTIVSLIFFVAATAQADLLDDMMKASNWYYSKRYPKDCKASFLLNMKVKNRKSSIQAEVGADSYGHSSMAFIDET